MKDENCSGMPWVEAGEAEAKLKVSSSVVGSPLCDASAGPSNVIVETAAIFVAEEAHESRFSSKLEAF
ncbi:hypothetical protein HJFPF1_02456 [Paramyrothecium foliicola]|nr:hypothetical protein HJFPF1_02456 [Paramyrothecium foliicola]